MGVYSKKRNDNSTVCYYRFQYHEPAMSNGNRINSLNDADATCADSENDCKHEQKPATAIHCQIILAHQGKSYESRVPSAWDSSFRISI